MARTTRNSLSRLASAPGPRRSLRLLENFSSASRSPSNQSEPAKPARAQSHGKKKKSRARGKARREPARPPPLTPFPDAFPPELLLEIASYLDFPTLLTFANASRSNRQLLRRPLLQTWGSLYRHLCTMPYPYHAHPVACWRQLPLRPFVVGKTQWRGSALPWFERQSDPGRLTWFLGHWMLWNLAVSGIPDSEGWIMRDLDVALGGEKKDAFAANLLLELLDLHRCNIPEIWMPIPGGSLGIAYQKTKVGKDREEEVFNALIKLASKECYFDMVMREEIWPCILDNKVNGRVLRILQEAGKIKGGDLPFEELEEYKYDRSSIWTAGTGYRKQFEIFKILIPRLPSYLTSSFSYKVRATPLLMDTAAFVALKAYEWLLDDDSLQVEDKFSDSLIAKDEEAKEEWRKTVREVFALLVEHGATFDRALRLCLVDEIDPSWEHEVRYAFELPERMEYGIWEVVMLLLDAGANPNAINPPEDEERVLWATPLHACVPVGHEKRLFYRFLEAGYDGIDVQDEEGLVPVLHLAYRVLEDDYEEDFVDRAPDTKNWKAEFLRMLETLLRERPGCIELLEWAEVLHIMRKEKEMGRNEELVRIVEEAEARRTPGQGTLALEILQFAEAVAGDDFEETDDDEEEEAGEEDLDSTAADDGQDEDEESEY
ncbi:hypothetical protein BJ508DRAFT_415437 [Ascobolus immersus RN42]|uniref:F-box domain-containing protein n=1 Tax=Ascobolus immersus RN42 TaxID=1160509 RepID=A0A3N4I2W2_ASCIM|nr:hypothetical protein BJ508DRAFT_415437 [Ascobolus immersus RN42]